MFENVNGRTTDDGRTDGRTPDQWVSYKLTSEPKGSGELISVFVQNMTIKMLFFSQANQSFKGFIYR